jgi:hypothetical protein
MMRFSWRPAAVWLLIITLIVLHHDFWQWDRIEPILWGWAPVALWYHVVYTLLCVAALYLLGRWIWPEPPAFEPTVPDEHGAVLPRTSADASSEGSQPS